MHTTRDRRMERGQVAILVVLALASFMLGALGFATDYTNFWFHRQAVQGAADATCQAGAMDLLLFAQGEQTPQMNFTPSVGATIDCASASTAAPCVIAKFNGYDGTATSKKVVMTFPSSVSGATAPDGVNVPFIQVDVTEQVATYFSRLLTGSKTVAVHASATCGLAAPTGPIPIVVLHPTDPQAISMVGSKDAITIIGGGQRSIQVNSSNTPSAVNLQAVDLSQAGPNNTGGDFGVFGGPASQPGTVQLGKSGNWIYPATLVSDTYRNVPAPAKPAAGAIISAKKPAQCGTPVAGCYTVNGCPDLGGCNEYTPGYYPGGINESGPAIFDPGLYYLAGDLTLQTGANVRTSTAIGDNSGGVMFYFSGTSKLNIKGSSGSHATTDDYVLAGGTDANGVPSRALQCPGGGANPPGLPATFNGNVLLGPCTAPASGGGDYSDPTKMYRGFLMFQDRSAAAAPQWQGGGGTLFAGYMYFHQCKADGTGTEPCSPPGSGGYGTTFNLGGNTTSGSYAIGSIVTDKITMNGNPGISMILSPTSRLLNSRQYS